MSIVSTPCSVKYSNKDGPAEARSPIGRSHGQARSPTIVLQTYQVSVTSEPLFLATFGCFFPFFPLLLGKRPSEKDFWSSARSQWFARVTVLHESVARIPIILGQWLAALTNPCWTGQAVVAHDTMRDNFRVWA